MLSDIQQKSLYAEQSKYVQIQNQNKKNGYSIEKLINPL